MKESRMVRKVSADLCSLVNRSDGFTLPPMCLIVISLYSWIASRMAFSRMLTWRMALWLVLFDQLTAAILSLKICVGSSSSNDKSDSTFRSHCTDLVHSSVALISASQELRLLRFSLWLFQIRGPLERNTKWPQIDLVSFRLT